MESSCEIWWDSFFCSDNLVGLFTHSDFLRINSRKRRVSRIRGMKIASKEQKEINGEARNRWNNSIFRVRDHFLFPKDERNIISINFVGSWRVGEKQLEIFAWITWTTVFAFLISWAQKTNRVKSVGKLIPAAISPICVRTLLVRFFRTKSWLWSFYAVACHPINHKYTSSPETFP